MRPAKFVQKLGSAHPSGALFMRDIGKDMNGPYRAANQELLFQCSSGRPFRWGFAANPDFRAQRPGIGILEAQTWNFCPFFCPHFLIIF